MDEDYNLLGLDKFATYTEIKSAYRKKLLLYHPDKSKTHSEKQFIELKQSYNNIISSLTKGKGKYRNLHHQISIKLHMSLNINKIEFKRVRFTFKNGKYKEHIETKTIFIPPNMRKIVYKEEGDQPVGFSTPGDLILDVELEK